VALPALSVTGPQVVTGVQGPGATYALYLPAEWNHELVLFAHGWSAAAPPLPAANYMPAPLRDGLLAAGYGVAMSSFTYGGFAVKDAMVRTAQLKDPFTENFGAPTRTYLMSISLGASVVMRMAEQNPNKYAGVMPICGIVAGVPFQLNHYFNTRVLFDYYYPGVLEGDAIDNPPALTAAASAAASAALNADLTKAQKLADIDQIRMSYSNDAEMVADILFALTFNAMDVFTDDLKLVTHGRSFFDNTNVYYTGSGEDATLNAGVQRFAADPDAANMVENLYSPSGDLKIPVLTLHTRADPIVPLRHETALADLVATKGASGFLLTRVYEGNVHCGIPLASELAAFQDLATWARTGVKPQS